MSPRKRRAKSQSLHVPILGSAGFALDVDQSSQDDLGNDSLTWAGSSSIGQHRVNNEDAYLLDFPLFVVADGMGGHEAGEIASQLAVVAMQKGDADVRDPQKLRDLVRAVNNEILDAPLQGIGRVGMGTTLSAAVFDGDRLLLAQVGDSRAYLYSHGLLRRLTRDHSLVEELVERGEITAEEAREHPDRSVITRVLGNERDTEPDIYELRIEPGDRLLLCSDGLHGMITDSQIAEVLRLQSKPSRCANALIGAANKAGGFDNITVVCVDIKVAEAPVKPIKKKPRLAIGVIAFIVALVVLAGAAVGGIWLYAQHSAFLITENGTVSVYRGLVGDVFGVELRWREEVTDISASQLGGSLPERLQSGIQVHSLDEAYALVADYQKQLQSQSQ
ncbi:MAG: Stp1/IreP family PP2C-type Ser/Thr phosphatase [Coriobacteriia bacterium]|nr:Stp1/IreP family PP2C-type Ser/Thr phosphatase [Coriobacteriia bacterium]